MTTGWRDLRFGAAVGAALAIGALLAIAAVWLAASEAERSGLGSVLGVVAMAAVVIGAVGGWLVRRAVADHLGGARRLAEEIDLLTGVDPGADVVGSAAPEITAVAGSVNRLAAKLRRSIDERDAAVADGRAEAEQDRQRLVNVMAALSHAVLVCGADGRILLYNEAAARLFDRTGPEREPLGLGRSAFGLIGRASMASAVHRLDVRGGDEAFAFTATDARDRLLRVTVGPIGDNAAAVADLDGFVVVVDEATDLHEARSALDELVRQTLEEVRRRLASIVGAVEMLQQFDDLPPADIHRFREIIADESGQLRDYLDSAQDRYRRAGPVGWELTDILAPDLLRSIEHRASQDGEPGVTIEPSSGGDPWIRVDVGGAVEALGSVVVQLSVLGAERLTLAYAERERFVAIEVAWVDGDGSAATDGARRRSAGGDIEALARRHGGEAWVEGPTAEGAASLVVLLPSTEPATDQATEEAAGDRPTVYDFSLLRNRGLDHELAEAGLADLACTVLDLETTGLDPSIDRIVSIGAVRIVNGRLLAGETFDQLVDPERPIPPRSTEIHGITDAMVAGRPTIATALASFARFVGESVLVGHNVAFDLRFLELQQRPTGVVLSNPVLDTLVLGELAFGESDSHSLEWLGETLGVDIADRHTAAGDALATARIFLQLIPVLETKGLRSLGQVIEASASTRYAALRY